MNFICKAVIRSNQLSPKTTNLQIAICR